MLTLVSLIPGFGNAPKPATDSINGVAIWSSFEQVERVLGKGSGGEEEEEEGARKVAWTLPSGDFSAMALKVNDEGEIRWLTGFLRRGSEKPFSDFGDLSKAKHNASTAIWSVRSPKGPYRLVVKGGNGKASVVYLIRLD